MQFGKIKYLLTVFILFSLSAIFITACGSDNGKEAAVNENLIPPSLRSQDVKKQIIRLDDKQVKELNIKTVTIKKGQFNYFILLPGVTYPAPDNIYLVSSAINGLVVTLKARDGEYVRKGELLLEIESLEFANMASEYLQARAEYLYRESQLTRIKNLVEKGITPQRVLEKAESEYTRAHAAVLATHARLKAIGVRQSQIDQWNNGKIDQPRLRIYSAIDGIVAERLVDLGQAVTSNQKMLTIINMNKVLVRGYASPEEYSLIHPGDSVIITLKNSPGKRLLAAVTTINPTLEKINKSISVNIITRTKNMWPKPGQNVRIKVKAKTPFAVYSIPLSALQYEGDKPTIFVQLDEKTYEKRPITLTKITEDYAIVKNGIKDNEKIAVSQIFSLKALGKYEEFAD